VPDLRYSSTEVHDTWAAIVVGGLRTSNGMPPMPLELGDAEAIRVYVLSLSAKLRDAGDNPD
jgi:hypothetical protein